MEGGKNFETTITVTRCYLCEAMALSPEETPGIWVSPRANEMLFTALFEHMDGVLRLNLRLKLAVKLLKPPVRPLGGLPIGKAWWNEYKNRDVWGFLERVIDDELGE